MGKQLTFNVLIDKEDETFVAHCLELGLVATAEDCTDVQGKMFKLIQRQVTFALENNRMQDVFVPAPKEFWERFMRTKGTTSIGQNAAKVHDPNNEENGFLVDQRIYAPAC